MKNYLNLDGLRYFLEYLYTKFSSKGHTHSSSEITDLQELVVTDDNNGNVIFSASILSDDSRIIALEEDIVGIKATLENNDILVTNNA